LVYYNVMERMAKEFNATNNVPVFFSKKEKDPYNFI